MRKKAFLVLLLVCAVSLMCAVLVKRRGERDFAASEANYLAMLDVALAIEHYHDANNVVPVDLRSLVPEYYCPPKSTTVMRDRLKRPGRAPILYIHVNKNCVVLVTGQRYWVVDCGVGSSGEKPVPPGNPVRRDDDHRNRSK